MEEYLYEEKEAFDGKKVKILTDTYEEGKPAEKSDWKLKLSGKEEIKQYLSTALRYWYSKDWYGSEKRKQEA